MATQRTLAELLGRTPQVAPIPEEQPPSEQQAAPEGRRDEPEQTERMRPPGAVHPPAPEPNESAASAELRTPAPGSADRITLYLHPDDHRALGLAKLDDRIDHNTRIRAMIALWRSDPDAVNELAARHKAP
ncbi:hypothetical protein [Sciscionella marina]|uniref:hypothetical protein n=1 Tax=Sciscionella marina TaxID=508770 RepID=UPI0003AAEC41|nr:hypothetical protein [Sciscionella marina]